MCQVNLVARDGADCNVRVSDTRVRATARYTTSSVLGVLKSGSFLSVSAAIRDRFAGALGVFERIRGQGANATNGDVVKGGVRVLTGVSLNGDVVNGDEGREAIKDRFRAAFDVRVGNFGVNAILRAVKASNLSQAEGDSHLSIKAITRGVIKGSARLVTR